MRTSRRKFLKSGSAALAGALLLPDLAAFAAPGGETSSRKEIIMGLQLYSVRNDMNKDAKGVLVKLAAMGYRYVEHAGYWRGKFYGFPAKEFKKILDGEGLKMYSGHTVLEKDHWDDAKKEFSDIWKATVDDAVAVGQRYVVSPALDESWRKDYDTTLHYMEVLNKSGELCKKAGVKFGYHNHNFEFTTVFPQARLYDVIMQHTDPALVAQQMDMGNMYGAGGRALELIKQYPGRYEMMHVKDEIKGSQGMDGYESTILGAGVVGTKDVVKEGLKSGGTVNFIIEQEAYQDKTPMDSVKEDLAIMRSWGF